jgi:hypothetical protein
VSFLPAGFSVPETLTTATFIARPLTVDDVVRDYDAVMTSRDRLIGTFGPESNWPAADLSLKQNLIDLGWHQKEFQKGRSFAYTLVDPGDTLTIGCFYVYPDAPDGFDASLYLWVRTSHAHMDEAVFSAVKLWLDDVWPFERLACPGRT